MIPPESRKVCSFVYWCSFVFVCLYLFAIHSNAIAYLFRETICKLCYATVMMKEIWISTVILMRLILALKVIKSDYRVLKTYFCIRRSGMALVDIVQSSRAMYKPLSDCFFFSLSCHYVAFIYSEWCCRCYLLTVRHNSSQKCCNSRRNNKLLVKFTCFYHPCLYMYIIHKF